MVPLAAAALAGCRPPVTTRPNLLLITLDTTRADHLGAYGDRRARTPNIDRLAAGGIVFERAIASAPLTLPSHASLLTGLYPFAHGVRNNGHFTLADRVPTIATALSTAGYRTAAFVSAFVLDRRYSLARGFDQYDDRLEHWNSRGNLHQRYSGGCECLQWLPHCRRNAEHCRGSLHSSSRLYQWRE